MPQILPETRRNEKSAQWCIPEAICEAGIGAILQQEVDTCPKLGAPA